MSPESLPLVSIITVNYNGAQLTIETIDSLMKSNYPNIEIIVVDNGSLESPDIIKETHPSINLIKAGANLGFAGGNNLGFEAANGDYFLLLNNDTEVEPDFLFPMVKEMESDERTGCVTCKLRYFEKPEIIQFAGYYKINMLTGRGFSRGWGEVDSGQYDDIIDVEYAHGAAMMVRRSVVEKIGMMAHIYFLYYEELDYCERIKGAGYKIKYVGHSTVLHKESMTVGKASPLKTYYMARNRWIFVRRYSRGLEKLWSFLFFIFISIPKGLISNTLNGPKHLWAFIKGSVWNLTNFDIYENPVLLKSKSQ